MRLIAVVIGSRTDLKQCGPGLRLLQEAAAAGEIELYGGAVIVSSVHRMNNETIGLVGELNGLERKPDAIIVGAGMANHLTGTVDAKLRYDLQDGDISVIGVAFEDTADHVNTSAAILAIERVPGTQVIFCDETDDPFVGLDGFTRACEHAVNGELPEITVPDKRSQERIPLDEAIAAS